MRTTTYSPLLARLSSGGSARRAASAKARMPSGATASPMVAAGFTIVELMTVVAVLAVLAALAAPSFTPLIERWRVGQAADAMQSTLYFARSEAIKRGGGVAISKLPSGTNGCTGAANNADWDCGWVVCVDTNKNGNCNAGEDVLQRYDAPPKVQISRTSPGAQLSLNRWGGIEGTYLGFNLVPEGKSLSSPAARGICMNAGGRVRIVSGNQIPCNS